VEVLKEDGSSYVREDMVRQGVGMLIIELVGGVKER